MLSGPVTGEGHAQNATHRKGSQMRYRAMFAAGFVVGFIAGTRAGRERYEQIVKYSRKIAGSPPVQKATHTVTVKTTEFTKTAVAKAPDLVMSAKQKAAHRLPPRFGGKSGGPDDVSADGHLVYPADDGQASVNGARFSAE
jgi:hypothetical protein